MSIRIQLFTSMRIRIQGTKTIRIRIQIFTSMRIRIQETKSIRVRIKIFTSRRIRIQATITIRILNLLFTSMRIRILGTTSMRIRILVRLLCHKSWILSWKIYLIQIICHKTYLRRNESNFEKLEIRFILKSFQFCCSWIQIWIRIPSTSGFRRVKSLRIRIRNTWNQCERIQFSLFMMLWFTTTAS